MGSVEVTYTLNTILYNARTPKNCLECNIKQKKIIISRKYMYKHNMLDNKQYPMAVNYTKILIMKKTM